MSGAHISTAEATALVHDAAATSGHGVTFSLGGDVVDQAETPYGGASNGVGVGAAAVVPLIAFGSLLAMGLPIATALMGIGSGLALIALLGFTGTKLARPSRLNTFLEGKVSELMLDYAAWIW